MRRWGERGDRELPWLAGPAFSVLGALSVTIAADEDARVLERFLAGAPSDPAQVRRAVAAELSTEPTTEAVPPDARGAVIDAAERFFNLLGQAYTALHEPVREAHRRYADEVVEAWRPRLDVAAQQLDERVQTLLGRPQPVVAATSNLVPPPPRRARDHPGFAVVFVTLAVTTAVVMLWLVLQGWPMTDVGLPL